MPSTVEDLARAADVSWSGAVRWEQLVPLDAPGVYVISLDEDPGSLEGALEQAPISVERAQELLDARSELLLDGHRPSVAELADRLSSLWLPGEVVLYVGKASSSVRKRVSQYYRTSLGARSPHAGGWFLKTLENLVGTSVHYAATDNPELAEKAMLAAFVEEVSGEARTIHGDPQHPYPFANIDGPGGAKRHGIRKATAPKKAHAGTRPAVPEPEPQAPVPPPRSEGADAYRTQRVTEPDIRSGRIRIPGPSKHLFPEIKSEVKIVLRGTPMRVRWDPRLGPDKPRSGVLSIGKQMLASRVTPDEILGITMDKRGRRPVLD